MELSTSEQTINYIKEHPFIRSCLQKDLINYSALARLVSKELHIEKKMSQEAILVAARRFREKIKKEISTEKKVKELIKQSHIEIKNKIHILILQKSSSSELIDEIHKKAREHNELFFMVQGSDHSTLVTLEKYAQLIRQKLSSKIIKHHENVALVIMKSPEQIEDTAGVISYTTSLFAENGVNILELLSCWRDTLFLINAKDVSKVVGFLEF
ncbi:hypothetical protein HYV86_00715 [Candidatus Woesearchaeota archaeon]|nr:hypothetical protein [Candidatus Woesearchaeota archaeon]